ncbi:MAG: NUDIX hydrolase [Paenibacillaceae bacterium]
MLNSDHNHKFLEKTIKTEMIFQGKIISLQVDHVELPNGQITTREIIRHPGAVCVLALLDDKMLVVEQYRKPLGKTQVEIPAGKLEPGEDPLEAAGRELEEETGYHCDELRLICSYYTSPGFADELIHFYVAENLVKGQINLDEDEFLECEAITLEQAQQYIVEKRISDAKTIAAVYAWRIYKLTGSF